MIPSNRKLWEVFLELFFPRTSCLARREYSATYITVVLVTNRLKIIKCIKPFFVSLTMFLLSTPACRYVVLFSFEFVIIVVENSMSFHNVFNNLEAIADEQLKFSHWVFTPKKKIIIFSTSLETSKLLEFSTHAYL